jgi:transposase-like protein
MWPEEERDSVTTATDNTVDALVTRQDARRQAVELYQRTSLTSGAIAAQVGVSRKTVYRWLRDAGVALGRNGNSHVDAQPQADLSMFGDQIAELRRDVTVIMEQLDRLEGLVATLVGGDILAAADDLVVAPLLQYPSTESR